jgi:hypothetical protein
LGKDGAPQFGRNEMAYENTDLIADREYEGTFEDGVTRKIRVAVSRPYRDSEKADVFLCDFVIFWPDGSTPIRKGFGVDAMQALSMALKHWEIETDVMKRLLNGKITFLGGAELL